MLPFFLGDMPRWVLEALATAGAGISIDAADHRDTVVHGRNGFLVPVRDVVALRSLMEGFIVEPELALAMGAESLKMAREKYDVHKVNAVILEAMGL